VFNLGLGLESGILDCWKSGRQELKGPEPNSLNGMKSGIFPNQNGNRKNERKNSLPVFDTVIEDRLPVFVPNPKNNRSIRKRSEKTGSRNGAVRDFSALFSSLISWLGVLAWKCATGGRVSISKSLSKTVSRDGAWNGS
jgi:hypothetical protein